MTWHGWAKADSTALRPWLTMAAWACLCVSGCGGSGPRPSRVWGEVTYDGKPIDKGSIVFSALDNAEAPGAGGEIVDGRYDIPASAGPQAGVKYRVEITAMRKTGRTLPNIMAPGSATMEETENYIPAVYSGKSTLQVAISPNASENQHDFKLALVDAKRNANSRKR